MFYNTNLETAREELEQLSKIIQEIRKMSDEESETMSEEFYPLLEQIVDISENEFNFSRKETYIYFKIKLWLEMYNNTFIEQTQADVLREQVKGRIRFLDDKGSVKDRDLLKACLEYIK